jgi:hypothetical protein
MELDRAIRAADEKGEAIDYALPSTNHAMRRTLSARCCAHATTGHPAAAQPSETMNSRRRIWIAI